MLQTHQDTIEALRAEIELLREANQGLTRQLEQSAHLREQGTRQLRILLQPLYRALQMVFDELDTLAPAEGLAGSPPPASTASTGLDRAFYDRWKAKVGIGAGKVLDALCDNHPRGMTIQALAVATGYNRSTIPQYLTELRTAGLIHTVGGLQCLRRE